MFCVHVQDRARDANDAGVRVWLPLVFIVMFIGATGILGGGGSVATLIYQVKCPAPSPPN